MEIGQQVFGKVGNKATTGNKTRDKTLTFWKVRRLETRQQLETRQETRH